MRAELEKRAAPEGFAGRIVAWLGAYVISFVGLLHLLMSGEHLSYATYLGILFLANFALSAVSALGIVRTGQNWAWLLGVAVAGGALVAVLVSRVFGLPGYPEVQGQWFNFAAWMAVMFELLFLAVASLALTGRGEALVETEQERIDREELPPDRQETPEHFALIEGEMAGIRARARPDLTDLRAHLQPSVLAEEAGQDVRHRVDGALRSVVGAVREDPRPVAVITALAALVLAVRRARR